MDTAASFRKIHAEDTQMVCIGLLGSDKYGDAPWEGGQDRQKLWAGLQEGTNQDLLHQDIVWLGEAVDEGLVHTAPGSISATRMPSAASSLRRTS